jgi:hypothetical protein
LFVESSAYGHLYEIRGILGGPSGKGHYVLSTTSHAIALLKWRIVLECVH